LPTGLDRLLAFVHPAFALATLVLLAYVASVGLRSRERGQASLRPRHARLAPLAYGLVLANLVLGLASTWRLRPDLELASTAHLRIGVAIAGLLSGAALLSRWLPDGPRARVIHPLLGLAALLLACLQVFFGLGLLPL
jgi:hypothetical protein